jgi:hypothetical protein
MEEIFDLEGFAALLALILIFLVVWALGAQWGLLAAGGYIIVLAAGVVQALALEGKGTLESTDTLRRARPFILAITVATAMAIIAGLLIGIVAAFLAWGFLSGIAVATLFILTAIVVADFMSAETLL